MRVGFGIDQIHLISEPLPSLIITLNIDIIYVSHFCFNNKSISRGYVQFVRGIDVVPLKKGGNVPLPPVT